MGKPVVIAVEDGQASRGGLARTLTTRYEADYDVIVESASGPALARLRGLAESGAVVALVLAGESLDEMSGVQFLAMVRGIDPVARRVLVITPRIRSAARHQARAWTLGQFDYFVAEPDGSPDERFHRAITEFLDEWWRLRGRGGEMFRVVGDEDSARCYEIRDLLSRSDYPYTFHPRESKGGRSALREAGLDDERRPVVILRDGRAFVDPSTRELGEAFGALVSPSPHPYDLTIIGGGPAGLAAAVYAGSEGLRTVVLEPDALGGQAGTSALIRNYLGFPRGVSGAELASRAVEQLSLFGAEIIYGSRAVSLRAEGRLRIVGLSNGTEAISRAVIVATGVSYRRLGVPTLEALVGAGVFYGAATSEAQALTDEHVCVVGAGNSAGQAALHLARYAERVTLLVRSTSLAASMSEYLITEITDAANIEIRYGVEVIGGDGDGHLEYLELNDRRSGQVELVATRALFVLIGAEPFTGWLPDSIARDKWGYVITGPELTAATWPDDRTPLLLETSLPGVFAAGDVRSGAVKRVAAGVGDGSICVRLVHAYLALGEPATLGEREGR